MRRLSSTDTKFFKIFVPRISFGLALLLVPVSAVWMLRAGRFIGELALVPAVIAAVGVFARVWYDGLVDEVWDAGDAFVVKNGGDELRLPISAIHHVTHSRWQKIPTITLTLHGPTRWGTEIAFMGDPDTIHWSGFRSRIFDEIQRRIADQKGD